MKFEKWLDEWNGAFLNTLEFHSKYRGGLEMKDKTTMLIPKGLEEKSVDLFNSYRIEKTNKQLVWATWGLAITTIILSVISLILR